MREVSSSRKELTSVPSSFKETDVVCLSDNRVPLLDTSFQWQKHLQGKHAFSESLQEKIRFSTSHTVLVIKSVSDRSLPAAHGININLSSSYTLLILTKSDDETLTFLIIIHD